MFAFFVVDNVSLQWVHPEREREYKIALTAEQLERGKKKSLDGKLGTFIAN